MRSDDAMHVDRYLHNSDSEFSDKASPHTVCQPATAQDVKVEGGEAVAASPDKDDAIERLHSLETVSQVPFTL